MEQYFPVLTSCALFTGIPCAALPALLARLHAYTHPCRKGELLIMAGYENRAIGIVLEGRLGAYKTTVEGAQLAIACLGPGNMFGDVLSGSHTKSPVTVTALQPGLVLWLPAAQLLEGCASSQTGANPSGCTPCRWHSLLLQNLIGQISDKYFQLSRRMDLLLLKSVRSKVLYYLHHEAQHQPDGRLLVPMTRTAWAEHLGCERSALCRELSRMQAQGLLQIEKRLFRLQAGISNTQP